MNSSDGTVTDKPLTLGLLLCASMKAHNKAKRVAKAKAKRTSSPEQEEGLNV